jgi:glucose uptake protein GlcU
MFILDTGLRLAAPVSITTQLKYRTTLFAVLWLHKTARKTDKILTSALFEI